MQVSLTHSMKSAIQRGLQITNYDMHQRQPFGSLSRWCNPFLVYMLFSCGIQRCKSICSDFLSRPDMTAEKITDTAFADFLNRFRRHKSSMFVTSFNRAKLWFFAGGTSATLPRSFTANKDTIAFNQILQAINRRFGDNLFSPSNIFQ